MARGKDTGHHPGRQVGRDHVGPGAFAPPSAVGRSSGPPTYYNQHTEWASDPVDPSWGAPTGPAANMQPLYGRSVEAHSVNGNPNAPTTVQKGAKDAGGAMRVTAGKAIPLGRSDILIPGHDSAGNYVAKPHSIQPNLASETGADAFNRHVENNPGAYPGGKMRYDEKGNVLAARV